MFKVDKSSVEYIDSNKEIVVIKQWLKENVGEISGEENVLNVQDEESTSDIFEADRTDEIVRHAKQEAQRLIDEAAQQAQQIKELARREAMEEETERIKTMCENIQSNNAEQLNRALIELEGIHKRAQSVLEQMILQLSLDIAQKIVNTQLEKNDTLFEGMIRQAVRRINVKSECTLRLNAREYQRHFADSGKWLMEEIDAPFSALLDNAVPPGGCILEMQDCVIKVGVDAQIKMIAMALNQ